MEQEITFLFFPSHSTQLKYIASSSLTLQAFTKHGNIVWCTHFAREAFCDINHAHLPPPEMYLHLASEDVMRACKEQWEVESKTILSVV